MGSEEFESNSGSENLLFLACFCPLINAIKVIKEVKGGAGWVISVE
jgi:hypothetical protein